MAIGVYVASDTPRPVMRDVGVINSAEGGFEVEPNEYRAYDVSSGECREYIADANTSSAIGTMTAEMMSNVAANLGVILMSGVTPVATGPATSETCATVAVGDVVETLFLPDADTLVVTDSDAGPSTLVLGTDYEFVAKNGGMIRFLDLAAYVQPFILDYTMIDSQTINPMSSLNDFWMISLSGGNERNSCGGEAERFYRARISAEQTLALHVAADTKIAVPMPVTFTLDRDPGRNFDFANFSVPAAA